jgi:hypothetical protein
MKIYTSENELIDDFKNDILTPQLLKESLHKTMMNLLNSYYERLNTNQELLEAHNLIMELRNKKNKMNKNNKNYSSNKTLK